MHQSLCSVYIKSAYLPLHSPRGSIIIPVIQTEKWRPPQREGKRTSLRQKIEAPFDSFSTFWVSIPLRAHFWRKLVCFHSLEFFLPGQSSYQKGEGGGDVETESGAGGCERQAPWVCLGPAPTPDPSQSAFILTLPSPPRPRQVFFLEPLPWKDNKSVFPGAVVLWSKHSSGNGVPQKLFI